MIIALVFVASFAGPQQTVDALFAAFNRHDVKALEALYAPDAVLTSADFCHPRSRRDIARTYGALFTTFPDIRDDVRTIVVQGDKAAVRFVSSSRVAGNAFRFELMSFFRFRNGRIVEDDTLFDTGGQPCRP